MTGGLTLDPCPLIPDPYRSYQHPLRARHALPPRINRCGRIQRATQRLEERLGHVMIVAAIEHPCMQIKPAVDRHRLQKMTHQVGLHAAKRRAMPRHVNHGIGPAAQIHRDEAERLIHRRVAVRRADDPRPITERPVERLAQADRHIFDRVMRVYVQIALGLHRQVEQAVMRKEGQHVIQEADPGARLRPAPAIHRQGQVDLSLSVVRSIVAVRMAPPTRNDECDG